MTRIKIGRIIWDTWNTEHIKKHNVSKREANEAITRVGSYRKGYKGRVILIGRSGTRILSILVSSKKQHRYYVITARDSDKKERRLLYEKEN